MKLLPDENLPHQLRQELPGHDCFTVAFIGWGGLENGALLARAAGARFDALITKDVRMEYEQNLLNLPLAVVILRAASNDIDDVRPLIPTLLNAPNTLPTKSITRVP